MWADYIKKWKQKYKQKINKQEKKNESNTRTQKQRNETPLVRLTSFLLGINVTHSANANTNGSFSSWLRFLLTPTQLSSRGCLLRLCASTITEQKKEKKKIMNKYWYRGKKRSMINSSHAPSQTLLYLICLILVATQNEGKMLIKLRKIRKSGSQISWSLL